MIHDKLKPLRLKLLHKGSAKTWVVTGVAGFIGSHIAEFLLSSGQIVRGIDNFATGKKSTIQYLQTLTSGNNSNFSFLEGDITDINTCLREFDGADFVLHQAALGSVPRSIKDPLSSHQANVTGFLCVCLAAKERKVSRLVYASSSSVYGDEAMLPKQEDKIGVALSPYAATKQMDEIYSRVFSSVYDLPSIGLRYFNVFGPRQDPDGEYAAVIPRWINQRKNGLQCSIYGDGKTSRDFCYVANVVEANILSALSSQEATNQVYNIAIGESTSLEDLYSMIDEFVNPTEKRLEPKYLDFRCGDIRHSQADISKARRLLGYEPLVDVREGVKETVEWFLNIS